MATKIRVGTRGPARTDKDNKAAISSEKFTKPGEKRRTYIVDIALSDKIDAIAHWDRVDIKDVVNEAFTGHVAKYEKKNGPVKPVKK
ncbi:MAG TPA: hypothetical protein VK489_05810 [Ferruginibacter sp.]|nr:hypothetical protein [Ferruginibacter sp.]